MPVSQEKRQHTRARIRWPIVIFTNRGVIVGETINIGGGGAYISCPESLANEEKIRLFIMVPDQRPLDIPAQVAWSNPYSSEVDIPPRGMGIRFRSTSHAHREFISTLLTDLLKKECEKESAEK